MGPPTVDYERHGRSYTRHRVTDPRIAAPIHAALRRAETVVNVGAGAGSYEPADRWVLAVEPSAAMRAQRPPGAAPEADASVAGSGALELFDIDEVLRAARVALELDQILVGADPDRPAVEPTVDGFRFKPGPKVQVALNLHEVEPSQIGLENPVPAEAEYFAISWVRELSEVEVVRTFDPCADLAQHGRQSAQVLWAGIGNDVDVLRGADEPMPANRHAADHDEVDRGFGERVEERVDPLLSRHC